MSAWANIWNELNLPSDGEQGVRALSHRTRGDKVIWSIVAILVVISLLAVYSSTGTLAYKQNKGNTEYYLFRQTAFIAVGVIIIYFVHLVDYRQFSRVALWLYLASIPLLLYTLLFGTNLNEANRWIKLPLINLTLQTSDLARLALFMYLARQISKSQSYIRDFKKGYLPLLSPILITCLLIAPANLSTALLTAATGLLVLFIGRASIRHLLITVFIALLPLAVLVATAIISYNPSDTTAPNSSEVVYTMKNTGRVGTWINRIQDFLFTKDIDAPFQVQQANIAIAKGSWLGLGPGNSEQRNFLPHPYSDFIYAIIIEEYGFLGAFVLVFLYLAFLFRTIRIVRKCPYAFGSFLSLALGVTLSIQALINMGVNVGLLPVTGVTLPLISMGGTSFLFTCFSIGILLSIARNIEGQQEVEKNRVPAQSSKKEEVPA